MRMARILTAFAVAWALLWGILLAVAPAGAEPITPPLTPADFLPGVLLPETTEGSGFGSQTFLVPAGGTTITFDVNILTREGPPPTLWYDYLVFGLFAPIDPITPLIDPGSGLPIGSTITVNDLTFTEFTPSPIFGPHGEEYERQSGVFTASLSVPASLEGTLALLGIAIFDIGDAIVDTGAIIDNIVYPGSGGDFTGGPGTYFGMNGGYEGSFHSLTVGGLDDFPSEVGKTGFTGGYVHISTGPESLPEPGTLLLLGSGFLLLGALGSGFWRRRG